MSNHIEILTKALNDAMAQGVETVSDYIELAATGELLRRGLVLYGSPDKSAEVALAKYEFVVGHIPADTVAYIEEMLSCVLATIENFAMKPPEHMLYDVGRVLLNSLDSALSVVVALYRAGHLETKDVCRYGKIARDRITMLAPRLSLLWPYAERIELSYGPDPIFHTLFSFWEELAKFSADRRETEAAIATAYIDPVRRSAFVGRAITIIKKQWQK